MNIFTLDSYMFQPKCSQLHAVHPLKKKNERKKDHYLVKSVQPEDCHVLVEPRSC